MHLVGISHVCVSRCTFQRKWSSFHYLWNDNTYRKSKFALNVYYTPLSTATVCIQTILPSWTQDVHKSPFVAYKFLKMSFTVTEIALVWNSICIIINLQHLSLLFCSSQPSAPLYYYYYYYYYYYSALGLVWAGTRAQPGDRYGSGKLHPGQVLRGSLPLLSPAFF